jgi:hypothetical protein
MILSNNCYNAYDVKKKGGERKKEEEEKKERGSIRMKISSDTD